MKEELKLDEDEENFKDFQDWDDHNILLTLNSYWLEREKWL